MKNVRQLQEVVNRVNKQFDGIDYQNRNQAIEEAMAIMKNEPGLLQQIVTDAINFKANQNVASTIDSVLKRG